MGLDLAFGGLVLLLGLRGWFKGFTLQAIWLAGLVGCVYLADPVRSVVKPHVAGHLANIQPAIADRILWCAAAFACFVVLVGVATLLVKLSRRRALGELEPHYNDQFAGFLFGLIKGAVVAGALAAGLQDHALPHLKSIPWAGRQIDGSRVLEWNAKYQPAAKVWASRPVQHFVNRIQRMGAQPADRESKTPEPVAARNRPPQLSVPPQGAADLARMIESMETAVRKLEESH